MTSADFEFLIYLVGHRIGKKTQIIETLIPVNEILAIAPRFLAIGDSSYHIIEPFKYSLLNNKSIKHCYVGSVELFS